MRLGSLAHEHGIGYAAPVIRAASIVIIFSLLGGLLGGCARVDLPASHHTVVFSDRLAIPASIIETPIDMTPVRVDDRHWTVETPLVEFPHEVGFDEALVSWNISPAPGAGASIDLMVKSEARWSPRLRIGSVGDAALLDSPIRRFDDDQGLVGEIDTDYFRARVGSRVTELRSARVVVTLVAPPDWSQNAPPGRVSRLSACLSATRCARSVRVSRLTKPVDGVFAMNTVPFRPQRTDNPALSGRLCSPTSLTMVLAFQGVDRPVGEVAARVRDPDNDIYGNWPRNIQGAFELGVPGILTRFNDWESVAVHLTRGEPIIASIRAPRGVLHNAPYSALDDGHLIVLTGLDGQGGVFVNDPAAGTPELGQRVYSMQDLTTAWMKLGKGTAYVLLCPNPPLAEPGASR